MPCERIFFRHHGRKLWDRCLGRKHYLNLCAYVAFVYDVYVFLLIYDTCINHRCYMLNHKTYHVEHVYFFTYVQTWFVLSLFVLNLMKKLKQCIGSLSG